MKIGVVYLRSDNAGVEERTVLDQEYLKQISELSKQTLEMVETPSELKEYDLSLVYVSGGGVEGKFVQIVSELPEPILILTHGENNSLAASMEINSYLHQKQLTGEIIHGNLEETAKRVADLAKVFAAKKKLQGMRFGCIGEPSDWLIASDVDPVAAKKAAGLLLVKIPMKEMFEEIEKHAYEENEYTLLAKQQGYDPKEVETALEIYGAIKRLCQKYDLQAVSIRCFDLLVPIHSTGCLALAILNSEGIFAGCEGDMTSLISMAVLGLLSDRPVFMCNPSRITSKNDIIFAHCTLPIGMPTAFHFMTHYESDLGVALAGHIAEGPCTVFKCSGDFQRHFVAGGKIVENLSECHLCRTQIHVQLPDCSYFLKNSIGNHHLVVNGDYSALVEEFFRWA